MPEQSFLEQESGVVRQAAYSELIRHNSNFRHLWLGNIVSLLGDWFNTIALYQLIDQLTGSPFALGAVFITKMLPWALASPVAGLIVDRFDRRHTMIASDLLRAVVVLGLLLIDEPDEVIFVYVLTALQVVIGSVFQPAQTASIPNITSPRELLTANALMSATWSVLLALGAALGGVTTEMLGIRAVFIIDSLTYLGSAYFIYRTVIPQVKEETEGGGSRILISATEKILEGWRHLRVFPRIGRIAFAKATWSFGGGALVYMLVLLAEEVSPGAQAIGIGVLYAARGIGTGVGPLIAREIFLDRKKWPAIIGGAIAFSGVAYGIVGTLPWTYWIVFFVVLAHAASGINWVLATVILQERTADRYRGRIFATEWLILMAAESCSILLASLILEASVLDLRSTVQLFAAAQFLCGIMWTLVIVPREKAAETTESGYR